MLRLARPDGLAAALLKHAGGDCLSVPPQGAAALRNPEPNFYILGAKSYGRNSNFLLADRLRAGARRVHADRRQGDLDLYKAAR